MKKKRHLLGLLFAGLALISGLALASCDNANNSSNISEPTQIEQVYAQYVVYAEAEDVELTREEWYGLYRAAGKQLP